MKGSKGIIFCIFLVIDAAQISFLAHTCKTGNSVTL